MPKLQATFEETTREAPLPKGIYTCHVKSEESQLSKTTGAPMAVLTFQVDGDTTIDGQLIESHDRTLPSHGRKHYVMLGGKNKDGVPYNLSNLFDTINALGAEWKCASCNAVSTKRFAQEKVRGRYHYLCPSCGAPVKLADHEQSWVGLRCRVAIDIGKMQDSDVEVNEVKRLYPIE